MEAAETVSRESEEIVWPAISIVGAATPQKFFAAFRQGDRESGFANRFLIFPFEGILRPKYHAVTGVDAEPPPRSCCHLFPPKPFRFRTRSIWRRTFFSTQFLRGGATDWPGELGGID